MSPTLCIRFLRYVSLMLKSICFADSHTYDLLRLPNRLDRASLLHLAPFSSLIDALSRRNLLYESLQKFSQSDDVWSTDLLRNVVLQSNSHLSAIPKEAEAVLRSFNTSPIYLRSNTPGIVNEGPYFLHFGELYPAYRLYPDESGAFIVSTVPTEDQF